MSALFSPIEVKGVKFRNRVVMPPMVTLKADGEGCVSGVSVEHYGARAGAGTGLIIVEATAVAEGHCDFAAVGNAMLEKAEWTKEAREALGG